jgi:indole-3-glycerol phosphate synthase
MSLIDHILEASDKRLKERMARVPLAELQRRAAHAARAQVGFRDALDSQSFSIIAEVKAASPSGGAMDEGNVEGALGVYDATPSVSAISILTDVDHFHGSLERLEIARQRTAKPLLRKDFIVNEYQVWEARAYGADAVLLMADLHDKQPERLAHLYGLVRELGMEALFELGMRTVGNPSAVVPAAATVWGVNSRRFESSKLQLRSRVGRLLGPGRVLGMRTELSIDGDAHRSLRDKIPGGKIAVAESGIDSPADMSRLHDLGYRAALIGTAFLKKGVGVEDQVRAFDDAIRGMHATSAVPAFTKVQATTA